MQSQTRLWSLTLLLFGSGLCALVYQIAWLREFRLIFGASTAASAAVLAIFMGGLGVGGVVFGRKVDRSARPLRYYATLEWLIASFTVMTPFLLDAVRSAYLGLGGTIRLGAGAGTLARLVLAAGVLAVPTLLMGGTLPAVCRAAESDDDRGRRRVGLLYGINTLGAVTGCVLATFFLLERFGTRRTLWIACALNLGVALIAGLLSRAEPRLAVHVKSVGDRLPFVRSAPPAYVLASAAVVGFAFFLMEIVWYRMLGPLLGGTVFTFGMILATALAGIGVGGAIYYFLMRDRPATLRGFATTCLLEAVTVAVPLALGDRLAILALDLRPGPQASFLAHVAGWAAVTGIVVFPTAIVAGAQFPLLIALLGRGREAVGRQVGLAYLWNTMGAIAGSLAGGFGLIPALTAPGCWRVVAVLLAVLGLSAVVISTPSRLKFRRLLPYAASALVVVACVSATGPTAVWRHGGIGVQRTRVPGGALGLWNWINERRGFLTWEADGIESGVALSSPDGHTFVINGKSDGNARVDAPTQVMVGMLGAILHPDPRRAAVIGLGTGSTAGWLGSIPTMEKVDVVELERVILQVADACAPVNNEVLSNPKVDIRIADAREVLLTSSERYDVIASEPSNPYRAGVASLFTREYYEAIASRLADDGLLVQWLQVYDVDIETLQTVYATLASVFPHLESWQVGRADLALVASKRPVDYDVPRLRKRLSTDPYRRAMSVAWRAVDLEGLLGRYVGNEGLSESIVAGAGERINTDDRTVVEFGFARAVGKGAPFRISDIRNQARTMGFDRPALRAGDADWSRVVDAEIANAIAGEQAPVPGGRLDEPQSHLFDALAHFAAGELRSGLADWIRRGREPDGPTEVALVAEGLAELGDEAALDYIERLEAIQPIESKIALARLQFRLGRHGEAAQTLASSFVDYRSDPWPSKFITRRGLVLAMELAQTSPEYARQLNDALRQPFAARILDGSRLHSRVVISAQLPEVGSCVEAVEAFEPHFPWIEDLLTLRADCYRKADDPRTPAADRALERFRELAVL